jgi:hypothetical protein
MPDMVTLCRDGEMTDLAPRPTEKRGRHERNLSSAQAGAPVAASRRFAYLRILTAARYLIDKRRLILDDPSYDTYGE